MRIARLDLIHYGKFSDAALAFPKVAGGDLQLIVGPNEAGKSTVRSAILELLYGIDKFSPYAYRKTADVELGALVEATGIDLAFRRLKTRSLKDSLADPAGTKLDAAVLARLMGNADKGFYERMFGLDHPGLVKGAKEMLNSSGDVGQMLFQAAAGVNGLHKLRERLEMDAGELWTKKQNMSCAYYVAQKRFNEAQATLKRVTASAAVWQKYKRALDTAEAALADAQRRFATAEREHLRLLRIRRVLPFLCEHDEAATLLATLGAPPLLPASAQTTLDTARAVLADAQSRMDLMSERLAEETGAAAAITVNVALLERKGEIDALAGRLQTYLDAVRDHPGLVAQRDRSAAKGRQLAAQLGWPETEIAAIAARVPAKVERSTLATFAQQRPALVQAATQAKEKLATQNEQIASLSERIECAGAHHAHPALASAVRATTALNLAVRAPTAAAKLAAVTAKRDAAFVALAPWTGGEATLRAMVLPSAAELQGFTDRRAALLSSRAQTRQTHDAKVIEATKAKAALDAFSRQHQIVTPDVLDHARRSRDELWRTVREGASVAEIGDQYERRVTAADVIADQRFEGVAKIEQQITLDTAYEKLMAEVAALAAQAKAADRELVALEEEWRGRMDELGLALTQPQLATWSALRDVALTAADALSDAQAACNALAGEARESEDALREALADAGEAPLEGASGAVLAAQAEAALTARAAMATRVGEWNDQLRTARTALPELQRRRDEADNALALWEEKWTKKLKAAGLPAELSPDAIATANETLAEIETACEDVRDNAGPRVAQMEREITTFAERARALAESCAAEAVDDPPEKVVQMLRDLLRDAESHSKKRDAAETAITKSRAALAIAAEDKAKAAGSLAPLYELAKVQDVEALARAIAAAERYRQAEERVTKAASDARLSGDNFPLAELLTARNSIAADRIEDLLIAAQQAHEEAKGANEAAIRAHTQAKADFEQIAGQDDAVRAESLRREGLLGMTEAVEEYVKITVGAKLVKWAVDRYSEEKQQPLLKRASGLFAGLTGGRFTKLSVNFDAEPPELVAYRADGSGLVAINGLSTGTEDQLYLALRLAALDLHLDAGTPLPLILDDIFINWSDERTAAGFKVLAELSERTQVIILSHHEHLIEVATNATKERVNIISLAA